MKSWACSLVVLLANPLPRLLHFSKTILSMRFPSKRIPSMVAVAFVLLAISPTLLALLFEFVLLKLPPYGTAGGTNS